LQGTISSPCWGGPNEAQSCCRCALSSLIAISTAEARGPYGSINVVSRKKGGFVLFPVVSNMKTEEAKTVAKDERLADFRKAALVVVDH
jgi:hypothetical protein